MEAPADWRQAAVLIVDDHPANLLAMKAVLGSLDARIVTAASGEEALRLIAAEEFALILLDVHMPGLDGFDTLARIRDREATAHLPAVFLTAVYNEPMHARRGYALGALDFITKPFDGDLLLAKVTALLSVYHRAQDAERRHREEADRLKEVFVAIVGHDLRTPLSAIRMAAAAMAHAPDAPESQRKNVERIEKSSKRMEGIIADLLDFTRARLGGGIPITRGAARLDVICRAGLDEAQQTHPDRVVRLDARGGDLRGNWDSSRLAQVVANLLGNALEHSSVDPVTIAVIDEGAAVSLQVHNGGPAIPGDALPNLFDPFHRSNDSRQGLGLGLYIVREIVHAHDGSVAVRSTANGGTTFKVTLPRTGPVSA